MGSLLLFIFDITAIISLLAILSFFLRLMRARIKLTDSCLHGQSLHRTLSFLDDQIKASVATIQQTLVEGLKKEGNLQQLDMDEAFGSCRERIRKIRGRYDASSLVPYIGSLDDWINTRIEFYIKQNKLDSKAHFKL